jgi:tetratricopeptide (TPR) repeat protein
VTAPSSPQISERDREVLRGFARRIDPADAGAHNNLGVLYFTKGLSEEAVGAFTRALEIDPKMQVAQRNLEIAYFNTGYYDQRVAELRERLRARPDDRDARWELGRAFALLGQPEDAIPEFQALLALRPGDVGAMIQLGLAEKAAGRLGTALSWFRTALGRDPQSALLHYYVGEVLYNQGAFDDALAALQRSIHLNPDHPDAHFLLSFVLGDMGRHEEAQKAGKRAVQLNPALSRAQANLSLDEYDPKKYEALVPGREARRSRAQMTIAEGESLAHYTLGHAFRQQGLMAEAMREYQMALERGEDRALAVQAIAELHLLQKEPQPAIALYDELLRERPDSPKLWNERGVALHQTGDHAGAAESYRQALAVDPAYSIARNNLAVAQFHAGKADEAVDEFREALTQTPSFVKARLNLALLLVRGRRYQLALEAYRQVLESDQEQAVAWNGVGMVLAELRKFEEARTAFARAIQSRPEYAEAHYNLSFTLSNLGDYPGALRETKRALEIDPYYVAQSFALAIDLEYEDPDLSVLPDLGGEQRMSTGVDTFTFDSGLLDTIFKQLEPAVSEAPAAEDVAGEPYALATDYLSKGLVDRAMAEIRRAMGRGADPVLGDVLLGEAFGRQGAWGDALERFEAARRGAPEHPEALRGETQALLRLGRGSDAGVPAALLLKALPNDADALMLVATARFEGGDSEGALEVLDQARRVAPERAEVLRGIGNVTRALGNLDAAIAAYRHALTLDGDFAAVRYDLAQLLLQRGGFAEAEKELLAALDAVPTYADATLALAALHRVQKRQPAALTLLIEFLERDPYSFDGLVALGELLVEMGRPDDAAIAFQRVLRFDPAHVGAIFHQGLLLSEQKRYREAMACFRRVAEIEPQGEFARRAFREARAVQQRVDGVDPDAEAED